MPLQPSQPVVWALWILALSKADIGDQWMDRTRSSGVVKARTIKWLLPGERWNGSLLDEARDSELAPVLRGRACPTTTNATRQVRRAQLRENEFERFGYTDSKQAVDHSEQGRFRMETILSTTTEGQMR